MLTKIIHINHFSQESVIIITITMDGAALFVKSLESLGVEYIFGIPGDTKGRSAVSETFIFRELKKSKKIEFIRTTHEQNAGYMADLYGRMSGKPGVCYTTLGPGSTNISTAIATANLDRSPVVCISSQLPKSEWHIDTHQYMNMREEFRHKTKLSLTVANIEDIPSTLKLAFETAQSERPGAVHIELPVDILEDQLDDSIVKLPKIETSIPRVSPNILIKELEKSSFPMFLVGATALRYDLGKEILRFMEKYNIPALTTFHGKGIFPSNHPLYIGVLSRHVPQSTEVLKNVDLLINIGYDYAEGIKPKSWKSGIEKRVINLDSDKKTGGDFYQPDLEIVTDLRDFFTKLNTTKTKIRKFDYLGIKKYGLSNLNYSKTGFPINPLNFVEKLKSLMTKDHIIIVDVGEHKQVMGLFYETDYPKSVVFSNGHSTLGYAFPGSLGTQIAKPGKKIVAVVGDGGFQMTHQEFITAVNRKLPVTVIILNDGAYGIIKHEQEKAFNDSYGVEFKNPDFVKLAQAYGGVGLRVTSSKNLYSTLKKALENNKPTLVDVPITYRNKLW